MKIRPHPPGNNGDILVIPVDSQTFHAYQNVTLKEDFTRANTNGSPQGAKHTSDPRIKMLP